mmetsp:Transcript_16011/g.25624  ORF Transcript_16011/g.25624 Transcript_16011/m.25624 type:complete len:834 (-) Transcript_16011:115-2616(-)
MAAVHSRTPATAFAELVDNAKDAGARNVRIGIVRYGAQSALSIKDDGKGMNLRGLKRMFGFGFSKRAVKKGGIGEYGAGFKSGSMKLGKNALVLTKHKATGEMYASLLSCDMHRELGMEALRQPIVQFKEGVKGKVVVDRSQQNTEDSLDMITRFSRVVANESILCTLMGKMKTGGTRVIISDINKDLEMEDDDILLTVNKSHEDENQYWKHERSLREYLGFVYGKLSAHTRTNNPSVYIRNVIVEPVVWSKTLFHSETDVLKLSKDNMLSALGDIRLHLGYVRHLKSDPGNHINLIPSFRNTPQGCVWLVNGRAVELFTPTKGQSVKKSGAWEKYTKSQRAGRGVRVVCEISMSGESPPLELTQNKDGFQRNEAFYTLLNRIYLRIKRYSRIACDKYFSVACTNPGCNHSNYGVPGRFQWDEYPTVLPIVQRGGPNRQMIRALSAETINTFVCPVCTGEMHPLSYKRTGASGRIPCTCLRRGSSSYQGDDGKGAEEDITSSEEDTMTKSKRLADQRARAESRRLRAERRAERKLMSSEEKRLLALEDRKKEKKDGGKNNTKSSRKSKSNQTTQGNSRENTQRKRPRAPSNRRQQEREQGDDGEVEQLPREIKGTPGTDQPYPKCSLSKVEPGERIYAPFTDDDEKASGDENSGRAEGEDGAAGGKVWRLGTVLGRKIVLQEGQKPKKVVLFKSCKDNKIIEILEDDKDGKEGENQEFLSLINKKGGGGSSTKQSRSKRIRRSAASMEVEEGEEERNQEGKGEGGGGGGGKVSDSATSQKDDLLASEVNDEDFNGYVVEKLYVVESADGTIKRYTESEIRNIVQEGDGGPDDG